MLTKNFETVAKLWGLIK